MKNLPELSCAVYLLCSIACAPHSKINLRCPKNVAVTIAEAPAASSALDLPEPIILTDCESGGKSYVIVNPTFVAGTNTVTYKATDDCDNVETCSFQVEVTVDFRAKFVGKYKGYRDCWSLNMTQTIPDQSMSVDVDYGLKTDYLHVGSDEVLVDSNGQFPHPYFGSYRTYALSFKADSIFIFQQWGALNSNQNCRFKGEKE